MSFEGQERRFRNDFDKTTSQLQRWKKLRSLLERNETLYYKIVSENIKEIAPIIYTPTVGEACVRYSELFRRPRGLYFSAHDVDDFPAITHNWPAEDVDVIVVTDGSRVLGLGDLGIQGIGVCIGKLDLYVAGAGIPPSRVLPCVLDVGTNNEELRNDWKYVGLHQPRLEGDAYLRVVDAFMAAVYNRWPNCLVQFEDFQTRHALTLLNRYRADCLTFNDDIQGTAGVALAGVLAALRALGQTSDDIISQRIVFAGAGSAGMGVASMLVQAMAQRLGGGKGGKEAGAATRAARRNIYLIDQDGLIATSREGIPDEQMQLARDDMEDGLPLAEVIRRVRPTILMGLSGAGKIFDAECLEAMGESCERPIIMPMSNPTSRAECSAEEAFRATDGRCIFASGSPFPDPQMEYNGQPVVANQGNNMYLFPGVGLGALASNAQIVSDAMLLAAARKLAELAPEEGLSQGRIFPHIEDIRYISQEIAVAVALCAIREGVAAGGRGLKDLALQSMTEDDMRLRVRSMQWEPAYRPFVQKE
jgi:malate dehydrogenase (decarboxylating)